MKSGRGGKREGSGRKKGSKWPSTLAKEAAREAVRQKITESLEELIDSQVAHAQGIKYLVARDRATGKFRKLAESEVEGAIGNDAETIEVWEKEPNVQAFTDLLNRALDKPKDQAQDVNLHVSGDLAASIAEGRARAAARNKKG